jgi:hypothetical protein
MNGIKQQVFINSPIFLKATPDNGYIINNSVTYLDSNLNITKIDSFYTSEGPTFFGFWVPNGNKSVYGVTIGGTEIYGKLFVAKTDQNGRVNIITPKPNFPLKIYPNPVNDKLNIMFELKNDADLITIEVYDLQLKLIKKTIPMDKNKGGKMYTISTDDLANGSYLLKINVDNSYQTYKFVK